MSPLSPTPYGRQNLVELESLLISLYVLVDEWWQETRPPALKKPGRPTSFSDLEVLTLTVLAQWPRCRSERDFSRFADTHLRPCFPNLLSHCQLNRRIRALEPELRAVQRDLADTLIDPDAVYRVLDTTLIPAIVRVRASEAGKGLFAGQASFGKSTSKPEWVYGFKVALTVDRKGGVTAFGLASANCDERYIGEALIVADLHEAYLAELATAASSWRRVSRGRW